MQTVAPDRTKITDTSFAKGFDEYDLWELWLLDEAEDVPCGSILTFLHYLCSEGTKHCEILNASTLATGFVDIRLTGPLADDERNHLLHYRLTRGNVGRLKEAEKDLLVSKLIQQYQTEDGQPHQKVRLTLISVGLSLAEKSELYGCRSVSGTPAQRWVAARGTHATAGAAIAGEPRGELGASATLQSFGFGLGTQELVRLLLRVVQATRKRSNLADLCGTHRGFQFYTFVMRGRTLSAGKAEERSFFYVSS